VLQELALPGRDLIGVQLEALGKLRKAFQLLECLDGNLCLEFRREFSACHSHGFNGLNYPFFPK
jgi:hypothetical protein